MKCPKLDCGSEGIGKFCNKCGTKRIDEKELLKSKIDVIICSGTDEDGKLCNARLTANQAFCENCGANVIKQFKHTICGICGNVLTAGSACFKCQSSEQTDNSPPLESPKVCESTPLSSSSTTGNDGPESNPIEIAASVRTNTLQSDYEDKNVSSRVDDRNQLDKLGAEHVPQSNESKQPMTYETERKPTDEEHCILTENQEHNVSNTNRFSNDKLSTDELHVQTNDEEIRHSSSTNGEVNEVTTERSQTYDLQTGLALDMNKDDSKQTTQNQVIETDNSTTTWKTASVLVQATSSIPLAAEKGDSEISPEMALYEQDPTNAMAVSRNTSNVFNPKPDNALLSTADKTEDVHDSNENMNGTSNETNYEVHATMSLESDNDAETDDDILDESESDDEENKRSLHSKVTDHSSTAPPCTGKKRKKGKSSAKKKYKAKREKKRIDTEKQAKVFGSANVGNSSNVDTGQSETAFITEVPSFFPSSYKDDKEQRNLNVKSSNQENLSKRNTNDLPAHDDSKAKGSKENSSTDSKTENTLTKQMNMDTVLVVFHVLVPKDIPNYSDFNLLLIGEKTFGGWKYYSHRMTKKRSLGKYDEYVFDRKIEKYLLHKCIEYKYCFETQNTKDHVWEHYHDDNKQHDYHNRKFFVESHMLYKDDVWHQYDGVVVPESDEGPFKKLRSAIKSIFTSDQKKASIQFGNDFFCELLPQLFKEPLVTETDMPDIADSINHLKMLINGLRKVYVVDFRCWKSISEFKQETITTFIAKLMEAMTSGSSTQTCTARVIQAMSLAVACHSLEIPLTHAAWQKLCACLLLSVDTANMRVVEWEAVQTQFKQEKLKNALTWVSKQFASLKDVKDPDVKDPSWLYCLPLVHLVFEVVTPFAKPSSNIDHANAIPRWWGTADIQDVVNRFHAHSKWLISLDTILTRLHPLFDMDYYLPRSIIAAFNCYELHELKNHWIPIEVACAALVYWTKNTKGQYYSVYNDHEKCVDDALGLLMKRLQNEEASDVRSKISLLMAYKISYELVTEAFSHHNNRAPKRSHSVHIFLHCTAMYCAMNGDKEQKSTSTHQDTEPRRLVYSVAETCKGWLMKITNDLLFDWGLEKVLKTWNAAFLESLQLESVLMEWNESISSKLRNVFTNLCKSSLKMEEFIAHYCKDADKYSQRMQDCLDSIAFEVIEHVLCSYSPICESERTRYRSLLSRLLNDRWGRACNSNRPHAILDLALTWSPMKQFVKLKCHNKLIVYDDCIHKINKVCVLIESVRVSLQEGTGDVQLLKYIQGHLDDFCDFVELIHTDDSKHKQATSRMIKLRMKEIESYNKQAEIMKRFLNLCQHFQVDTQELNTILRKDVDRQQLRWLCDPKDAQNCEAAEKYEPCIVTFKTYHRVINVVSRAEQCLDSFVFLSMWTNYRNQYQARSVSVDELLDDVWLPVEKSWKQFGEQLQTGDVFFDDVDQKLASAFQDRDEQLEREITIFDIPENEAKSRISQIKQWRQLRVCVTGALAILKLQKNCNLTGNFKPIQKIARFKQNKFKMNEFDDNLMKTCDLLQEVTHERSRCLEAFCACEDLVKWLQESMKDSGQKELKVFVDLAMMSVGDDPDSIRKVQCLHSAVIGYSPLIFDLKPKCGYSKLLDKCRTVWKEFSANPKLPEQLVDINDKLPWLMEIQKAHGSVEVTSLMQADAITCGGIFTVSFKEGQCGTREKMLNEDNITATVSDQYKQYNFQQLQDLQSRLMLVAGRSQQTAKETWASVDMFTLILDSVTRLGNVVRKLRKSGCVLFNTWKGEFWCKQNRRICVEISIGNENDKPKLVGRTSQSEKVQHHIPEISKFFEKCLEKWLIYIQLKRSEFYFLNFFTTDQLVILQQELAKMGSESLSSPHIFSLLSAVKKDCTAADLVTALRAARIEVDSKISKQHDAVSIMDNPEETIDDKGIESNIQRAAFVQELVLAGFDQSLAYSALDQVDEDDIASCDVTQAILWCLQHSGSNMTNDKNEEKMETDNVVQADVEQLEFAGWNTSSSTLESIIKTTLKQINQERDDGVRPLIECLTDLWENFLESVSSSISDFLSLEHLGIFLKHLAVSETESLERTYASRYKVGEPNLIVCPSGEILKVTLSIYMHDKKQPLPMSDEVLVCHADTTIDEIEIFWRRAIFGDGRKIHCLVNADLLNYDVGEAADRTLQDYILETNHKTDLQYRLFIICGSDNKYRCPLVSSLDKYDRQVQTVNQNDVMKYVEEKLVVPLTRIHSASNVDFSRCSARIVMSTRAGVGKTLYVQRQAEALKQTFARSKVVQIKIVKIPLEEKNINIHEVIQAFLEHTPTHEKQTARLFHIDISHEVQEGIDLLLFNLLILNCLTDKNGYVWRRSMGDLYLVETLPIMTRNATRRDDYAHQIYGILPGITCRSPTESLNVYKSINQVPKIGLRQTDQLFDEQQFRSPVFQRTYQYLQRYDLKQTVTDVDANIPEGDPNGCLDVLLRRCGVINPSWSELHNFVWFLNTQLVDYEQNQFVSQAASEDLPGFATFVLRFLMQMSKDFATRSLNISEESPSASSIQDDGDKMEDEEFLNRLALRRTWESSPHPYLFFNSDHFTFTFLGFFIERPTGNLIDLQTSRVLEQAIMVQNLYDALVRNKVPLQENFDNLERDQKIMKLCNVMGIEVPHDPDSTYELTTDNVKKILAIYMRFRCDIPVVIMGETGCGKTRLVKFMCALQCPPGVVVKNIILMKVHGGTTKEDIKRSIQNAEEQARQNVRIMAEFKTHIYTVLFFDEANTTEAIGIIKEVMCDKSICGEPLKFYQNLKIVAACNPYRKHPEELIHKLEQAGLGYHVDADETTDKLGRVPMRRLVYRVQPLPQSLLPLVWDFGQLNTDVETLYVRQMVKRYIDDDKLPDSRALTDVMSRILTVSQQYMRDQKDECSFVSLRDVQRVLKVMAWFYEQADNNGVLFEMMNRKLCEYQTFQAQNSENEEEDDNNHPNKGLDNLTRSLVLALGVCYHACLSTRKRHGYRKRVSKCFREPCVLPGGAKQIAEEIECCQDVFLDNVSLDDNIAKNTALKENVFMMVVCIELRIPLFLVGKPGSSKSLAKTIVADAMQGNCSKFQLFKHLKQVQMVSFQCSPLATPDGIVGTFRQCAQFQEHKDLDSFVSVVVLDEVGLAEDSPRMPLKTLHPLLEDGCQGDEKPELYKKVAFIGISNWALDPAKMNRGIFVQREVPDIEELTNSARGICQRNKVIQPLIEPLIKPLSKAYRDVFKDASKQMREFYGLRDFYSLVKMVYDFVEESKQPPTWFEMLHAIKRNFGGLEKVNPEEHFQRRLRHVMTCGGAHRLRDPDCSAKGLIEACLFASVQLKGESRYLLLLTENYGALSIIQQQIFSKRSEIRPITIFGSSFRSDQEYTQVCRNINKIKVCMETGNTVVLLNLENLYESLYDALNQYYVYFGGVRYVDLGLGTHRVKCPVHQDFRLIVVAEKQTVYKKFPIPLINRLEKHFLTINSILNDRQIKLAMELQQWANMFATDTNDQIRGSTRRQVGDVFIGFHEDTCSAIIMHVVEKHNGSNKTDRDVLEEGKQMLLWCATPESFVCNSQLDKSERDRMAKYYYQRQAHDSFIQYLKHKLEKEECRELFAQITCHSKLLAGNHEKEILKEVSSLRRVEILSLSSFDTEQQFSNRVQHTLASKAIEATLLIIQCDSGDMNSNLIACARYCVMDEVVKIRDHQSSSVFVVFVVQLPRKSGGCFSDFQCGDWHSAHIDDLYPEDDNMPQINFLQNKTVSEIFSGALPCLPARSAKTEKVMDILPNVQDVTNKPIDREHETESMDIEIYSRDRDSALEIGEITLEMKGYNEPLVICNQQRINLCGLVRHCVQPALSMVKDNPNAAQRETKRVDIVLRSLPQCVSKQDTTDKDLFTLGILAWIVKLFKEKENETGFLSEQWLIRHAAAMENINKNGTLRRSCYNTIISKVAPVLAGVFAFLDSNSNMDLVECNVPWKRDFWLKCLNRTDVLPLKYCDCQSPKGSDALKELLVSGTGYEGHEFKLRLPFSWVLINMVDELFRDLLIETVEVAEMVDTCVTALKASSVGQLFSELNSNIHELTQAAIVGEGPPDMGEILQDYIHDYVQTVYNAGSEAELNIVCEQVMSKSNSVCCEIGGRNDLVCHIVCCRFVYDELSCKLTLFRNINYVWPACSSNIAEIQQSKSDHFMFNEHEFTFSALCMLLDDLTPKPKELDKIVSRKNWLSRVYRYRPVVETMLHINLNDVRYGFHSENTIRRAKSMWSRILVMKLFVENVCTNDSENNIAIRHCMPMWELLGDDANLGGMKSFGAVESFLRLCNQSALRETIGSDVKCSKCEENMQCAPVTLPCKRKDKICQTCLTDLKALKESRCPICKESFPKQWEPNVAEDRRLVNKLQQYQKHCNTFFLEVVSQLCFANGDVSEGVINKLLGYVTCKSKTGKVFTKNMNIIDTGLDPNPVFRSFLLQLMLKSRKERYVSSYLNQFIEHTKLDSDTNPKDKIDIYLLIVQCWEDTQLQCIEQSAESRAASVCELLGNALVNINNRQSMTELLYGIATTRACLAATARCLAELVEGANRTIPGDIRNIIQAAKEFCDSPNTEKPKVYLVKVLCRRYGIDIYHKLSKSCVPIFNWIAIEGTAEQVEVSDRYIVLGETYRRVREAIAKTLLGEDVGILNDLLQEIHTRGERLEIVVQLAVHREVTCANVRRSVIKPKKGIKRLAKLLSKSVIVENKEFVQRLLNNDLHPRFLAMRPETDMLQQGVQCLLTHFKVIMSKLHEGSTLLYPLMALINGNPNIQNMFLPTMPQDDLEDIHNAVLRNRGNENPVVYRCPRGHPYLIGDCGRPNATGFCPECRQQIGGTGHQALPGNIVNNVGDTTKRGHILGRASKGGVAHPERDLNPAYRTAVRLLLHMAMYLGPVEQIQPIIQPVCPANQVSEFLLDHIIANISSLQRALGRSADDVILLMHAAVHNMMLQSGKTLPQGITLLSSKADRRAWENEFSATVLREILGNVDHWLTSFNNRIATDQRLGADPLMCLIYETDNNQEREDPNNLLNVPRMWRFRIPITVDHMRQELDSKIQGLKPPPRILQRFLVEDYILQALRYLPNIMLLLRALLQKFQKKLDRAEASMLKVKDLKKELLAGHETERWLDDFSKAWEITRMSLSQGCPTKFGRVTVPEEFSNARITDNTPLAVLLPAANGPGLCSYAMLDLLFRKQNELLDFYVHETGRQDAPSSVIPMAVTSAHLISYDHEHDLMPLVLANCHFSFEMGVGTKIEYDFAGMERQLMDRLLYSKSRIEIHQYLEIDLMVYRTEVTNVSVFKKLQDNIPQEQMNAAVRNQICEELRVLPDVCASLDNLDIAISFLKTTGGDPAMPLYKFMVETLRMDKALLSQKARQSCDLRHARSLWLLLSFHKSRLLVDYRHATEAVLETLPNNFYQDLPEGVKSSFEEYMKQLSIDKLSNLVELLHEFLLLKVAVHENPDDDDFVDTKNYSLFESLRQYIELSDTPMLDPVILNGSPEGLLYEHSAKAWVLAYETVLRKIGSRRRN